MAALLAGSIRAEEPAPGYEVRDGRILAFGHLLEPTNPLPPPGALDEGPIHRVLLRESPDGRWVLILSDVQLTSNDLWIHDTRGEDPPVHLLADRPGRHIQALEWHSARVFEISWVGMGYRTSRLFDVDDLEHPRSLDNLLLYEPRRDLYVRYRMGDEQPLHRIEVGFAFGQEGRSEEFPIRLDAEYLSEVLLRIGDVDVTESEVRVDYTQSDGASVEERFSLELLGRDR